MWFFKKKKQPEFNYQKELDFIHDNLKDSFSRIKQDIKIIKDWISHLNDKDSIRTKEMEAVQTKMEGMDSTIHLINLTLERQKTEPQPERLTEGVTAAIPEHTRRIEPLDSLTDTQQAIFHRAGLLLKEADQEWIAIKTLATDLYPNKPYDQVRSTTSEYIGILVDNGLLEKRRRGKQTYVCLTKKGEQFFQQARGKTLKKAATKRARKDENI